MLKPSIASLLLIFTITASTDAAADDDSGASKTVAAGETWIVSKTTRLDYLGIAPGGNIAAPGGYSVTLTVNGVETGQALSTTAGVATQFVPATYRGKIVLTVAEATLVDLTLPGPPGPPQVLPVRQALYLDATGIVEEKSVPAAVIGRAPDSSSIQDVSLASTGQAFNGIYAAGGTQLVENVNIDFTGNGRSDFVGDGAAVVATGTSTNLVLDGVDIRTHGVVRTGVVATGGSNVVVKNSSIHTLNGVLPADYAQTVDLSQMRSVPWMLGINGFDNVRATNLLGPSSKATYINSSIGSEGWGVLSTDSGSNCTLTVINSRIDIAPGNDGYGSYAIGNATEYFLGARFDVGSYATINTGGTIYYDDSTPAAVATLNASLGLGLTSAELASLPARPTIIHSRRFGVMWHSSSGAVSVAGGTVFDTAETTFLDKSYQAVAISVDGSAGARLRPGNGIILQVMDDDDPGPQGPNLLNNGIYVEPTTAPIKDPGFDVTSSANAAAATFSNIALEGNFYNSSGWTLMPSGGPFGPPPGTTPGEPNMALTFDNARITGVITSSEAHHHVPTIDSTQYAQLGEVTNRPRAAINNGAIVALTNGSRWTVTGTSYLTKLVIAPGASVRGLDGQQVRMTVNGSPTAVVPGTYAGAIVLTLTK